MKSSSVFLILSIVTLLTSSLTWTAEPDRMGEDGTGQKVIHPKHALPVCGTPIVRDLEKARRRGEMTHEQLRMANIILERDELEETYNTDNFTIDYTNNPDDEDGDCVFDPDNRDENARNEDGERVPMYVVRLGQYLESALWTRLIPPACATAGLRST